MRTLSPQIGSNIESDVSNLLELPEERGALNVVCIGAHPDDPETGCGGTLAKFAAGGHNVTVIYLTRGEAGIREAERHTAATIRTAEALKACTVLGAKAVFSNQIDGETSTDRYRSAEFADLLAASSPDIVFTHWPLDTHRDHRTASLLTYEA